MPNPTLTRLLFTQGGLCFFCKQPLPAVHASVEHLVAISNGGSNRDDNCVACCKSLNSLLGSMSLKEKIQVFLNQKGQFDCPNGVQRKTTKTGPSASGKARKFAAECYAQVVANLRQRGSARPRTVAKLKSTVAALFQNKLSANEVAALVQELESRRVISIAGSKYYIRVAQNNLTGLALWFYTETVKGLIYMDQVIMKRALPVLPVGRSPRSQRLLRYEARFSVESR